MEKYTITSVSYDKLPFECGWSFEMQGYTTIYDFPFTDLVIVEKAHYEDIKNENDQCLMEIERLENLVKDLEKQKEQLQKLNTNQAKMLKRSMNPYKIYK